MTVFKIKWHVAAMIKKALYKILFGKKIQMGGGLHSAVIFMFILNAEQK